MEGMDADGDTQPMPTTSQTAAGGASPFAAAPPPRNSSAAATADAAAAAAAQTADTHMPDAAAKSTFTSQTQAAIEAADKAADQLPPRMSLTRGDSLAALQLPVHPDIAVFGWGRNDCGQLGFPPDQGSCPRCSNTSPAANGSSSSSPAGPPGIIAAVSRIRSLDGKAVTSATAGLFNTALLTADGELYMLGSNDSGLLGRRQQSSSSSSHNSSEGGDLSWQPVRVEALEPYPLADVAVGTGHALAVTQQGLLATWGENEFGQLGNSSSSDKPQHNPRLLRNATVSLTSRKDGVTVGSKRAAAGSSGSSSPAVGSSRMVFVRVAAGTSHSVALTTSGRVLTWGQGNHGVLGIPDVLQTSVPVQVPGLWEVGVVQIAAGEAHCVALSAAGRVFSWGRGKYGQLGHGTYADQHTPKEITALTRVTSIVAGDHHTLVLAHPPSSSSSNSNSNSLQVYAFGRGTFGATGLGINDNICRPSCVTFLSDVGVVQVAAGRQHSVALTRSGEICTWGDGQLGQLGIGCSCSLNHSVQDNATANCHALSWLLPAAQLSPKRISSPPWPAGSIVLFIAAGGDHSVAVVQMHPCSSSGQQQQQAHSRCSLDMIAEEAVAAAIDKEPGSAPMDVDRLAAVQQQQQQQQVASWQQSGPQPKIRPHGSSLVPVQTPPLLQLATAAAAEAAAARRSTGAGSPESGAPSDPAAAAAAGGSGSSSEASPVVINLAHAVLDVFSSPGLLLQLFAATPQQQQQQQQQTSAAASSAGSSTAVILHGLDLEKIESVFTILLKSYAREVVGALGSACVRLLQDLPDSTAWRSNSSPEVVRVLFILLQNPLNSDIHGLGSTLIGLLTALILKLNSGGIRLLLGWLPQLKPEVFGARVIRPVQGLISRLVKEAAADWRGSGSSNRQRQQQGLGAVRDDTLLLARLLDVFHAANIQAGEVVPYAEFSNASVSTTADLHEEYYQWLHSGAYKLQYEAFQEAAARATSGVASPTSGTAHYVNHQHNQQQQQQSGTQLQQQQQQQHLHHHRAGGGGAVIVPRLLPGGSINSLCEVPFLLTTEAKQNILRDEATLQQQHVVHASAMAALLQGLPAGGLSSNTVINLDASAVTLALKVRRGHVMEDALKHIRQCSPQDLKKPLRVTYLSEDGGVPEEGVDQGGVSREFFQLLVAQLFSPDFGMFVYVEESRTCWFNPASLESLDEFEYVGTVLGLACYNGIILDAHLPLTAYKKLMGHVPSFSDLSELYPDLADGLQQLLDFQGDVENTFCRNFEVEYEAFGEKKQVELLPGGANLPVTADNRRQFVDLYSDWLLSGSVAEQFAAFASGFHRVCGGPALSLFRYEEVELLVEGLPHLDFQQMQAAARYEAGYYEKHPTVQNLWSVLLSLPIDEKRLFLQFCTGCDRAPVAGLGALKLLVQRAGPDSEKLPTAHTCFNTLLLPDYSSKDKVQRKLMTAIHNAQGFGLQ